MCTPDVKNLPRLGIRQDGRKLANRGQRIYQTVVNPTRKVLEPESIAVNRIFDLRLLGFDETAKASQIMLFLIHSRPVVLLHLRVGLDAFLDLPLSAAAEVDDALERLQFQGPACRKPKAARRSCPA